MARFVAYEAGRLIFRDGDPCPGVFVVAKGVVRVYKTSPGGKEHVLHLAEPGSTFAEVAAIGGFDCPAHAAAVTDCRCVLLPNDRFRAALHKDHELALGMMTGMSRWVRGLVSLLEDIVLRDAAARLARYLIAQADETHQVRLPARKRDVANHLNLTSETLSRLLSRFEAQGWLAREGDALKLLDPQALDNLASGLFPRV